MERSFATKAFLFLAFCPNLFEPKRESRCHAIPRAAQPEGLPAEPKNGTLLQGFVSRYFTCPPLSLCFAV